MHINIQHLEREALQFLEVLQMLNENIPFSIYLCVGITFTP